MTAGRNAGPSHHPRFPEQEVSRWDRTDGLVVVITTEGRTSYFDLKNGAGRWVGFGRAATDLVGSGGHSPQLVLLTGPGC